MSWIEKRSGNRQRPWTEMDFTQHRASSHDETTDETRHLRRRPLTSTLLVRSIPISPSGVVCLKTGSVNAFYTWAVSSPLQSHSLFSQKLNLCGLSICFTRLCINDPMLCFKFARFQIQLYKCLQGWFYGRHTRTEEHIAESTMDSNKERDKWTRDPQEHLAGCLSSPRIAIQ